MRRGARDDNGITEALQATAWNRTSHMLRNPNCSLKTLLVAAYIQGLGDCAVTIFDRYPDLYREDTPTDYQI